MKNKSGKLVNILENITGIFIVEKKDNISTQNLNVEVGTYLVLDIIGDKKNIYIEILHYNNVVLITYVPKICRFI